MRVLFDEMLPRRLKRLFPPAVETVTVRERGWGSKENGELLELAEKEFDALLTTDKGTPHQQDLACFDLAVVLPRAGSNAFEDLAPLMDEAIAALASTAPGTVNLVPEAPR